MLVSRKFSDTSTLLIIALAIIALMMKRNEIINETDESIRREYIKEFELNVNTLNKALDYLAEIRERHK